MNTTKRQRGRPAGSGKKDESLLRQVADSMVRAEANGTKLTATAAMNQALRAHKGVESCHQSAVRRLQRKWRGHSAELMAAARRREADRVAQTKVIDTRPARRASEALFDAARGMSASQKLIDMASGHNNAVQALMTAMRQINPMADVMRQMFEREQRIRDMIDPPGLRAIRELTSTIDRITKASRLPF